MSNWIKAETSKTCPVMSSAFGLIYFGSYGCRICDYNLGYDKETGMIKCCYESSLKLEKKPDLREDLRKDLRKDAEQDANETMIEDINAEKLLLKLERNQKHTYIAFGVAVAAIAVLLITLAIL